jgi:hypothetical protein
MSGVIETQDALNDPDLQKIARKPVTDSNAIINPNGKPIVNYPTENLGAEDIKRPGTGGVGPWGVAGIVGGTLLAGKVMPAAGKFINAQTVNADGTISIDFNKVVSGAYQLSIVTYGLATKRSASQKVSIGTGLAVQNWFKYVVGTCVPAKGATLGYVPLGGALKTTALNIIKTIG